MRTWFLTYINIIHLHTFSDVERLLICISCNIFLNHTINIQNLTKEMIS
jgi:hypothetical protein